MPRPERTAGLRLVELEHRLADGKDIRRHLATPLRPARWARRWPGSRVQLPTTPQCTLGAPRIAPEMTAHPLRELTGLLPSPSVEGALVAPACNHGCDIG